LSVWHLTFTLKTAIEVSPFRSISMTTIFTTHQQVLS